jgi:serine/threonine protein kinase
LELIRLVPLPHLFAGVKRARPLFSFVTWGAQTTNQEVAVKIISKKKLSPEDTKALWNEIEILDSLDHPNILRYFMSTVPLPYDAC